MIKNSKILILTGSYGNGHLKVSKTLKETFLKNGCNDVIESDLYLEAHPLLTKATKFLYIKSFSYGQRLYGSFYYAGNKDKNGLPLDFMNYYGRKTLANLVNSYNPDIIINTFPMVVVPEFLKKSGSPIPMVNVLTDFGLHNNWTHEEITRYFVASEDLKAAMVNKGISPDKIKVSGIPIEPSFEQQFDRAALIESYGLNPDKPLTLLASGAYGVLKNMVDIVNRLLHIDDNQVIVVCGHNKKLKTNLINKFGENKNVQILGYTNKMDELMKMATVMVTKPGGITLSEALAVQVPLILYRSVPGQERENALFFEQNGASLNVSNPDKLIKVISDVITNEGIQLEMKRQMNALYHANASEVIYENVSEIINREQIKLKKEII
ncbi:MGDG synthase family glycosyltransferase [Oceanobacillus chungangensis]|uniref:Diglucosyl diacylglycerol synthase n=1 Tax=Oceanobacillus chungangensis TaxID=1229152 RepID=A0A3D8PHP3_9BACI|nr:glycosyltransferase [Oceanobacillus chungangensis]RDW15606.1 diglucosyl diacylglycerol synthase [Oceanobacillus chungangensis]